MKSGSFSAGYEGGRPAFCLLVFILHCFIVFWLSHDSSGFYFVIFCPAFSFLAPLSLPLSHSSAIPAVCEKASTADRSETQSNIQLSANTLALIAGAKICKHDESAMQKNVLFRYRDVRKTKQDAGSHHLNGDQLNSSSCLTSVAPAAHSDRGSLLPL